MTEHPQGAKPRRQAVLQQLRGYTMPREVARLPSSSLSMGGVLMLEIPENEDNLTALVLRTETGVYGWLNSCPHDGRSLCNDPSIC